MKEFTPAEQSILRHTRAAVADLARWLGRPVNDTLDELMRVWPLPQQPEMDLDELSEVLCNRMKDGAADYNRTNRAKGLGRPPARIYSAEDDKRIIDGYKAGLPCRVISKMMGLLPRQVSDRACQLRAKGYDLPSKKQKKKAS